MKTSFKNILFVTIFWNLTVAESRQILNPYIMKLIWGFFIFVIIIKIVFNKKKWNMPFSLLFGSLVWKHWIWPSFLLKPKTLMEMSFWALNLGIWLTLTGNSIPSKFKVEACSLYLFTLSGCLPCSTGYKADNTAHLKHWSSFFITLMQACFLLMGSGNSINELPRI